LSPNWKAAVSATPSCAVFRIESGVVAELESSRFGYAFLRGVPNRIGYDNPVQAENVRQQ
jgi:hypothetical protein